MIMIDIVEIKCKVNPKNCFVSYGSWLVRLFGLQRESEFHAWNHTNKHTYKHICKHTYEHTYK